MEKILMSFHIPILLVVILLLFGFLIIPSWQKRINKGWLKKVAKAFTIAAILSITFAVLLFPDLRSVKTTGEYSYASCTLELTDTSRIEEYDRDGGFRKLSVLVYYPNRAGIENNSCPLIVYSHGGISTKTSNLSLYKELASHGYVVVSIDHTYHALRTKIDGKNVSIDPGYRKELIAEDSHSDIKNSYACFEKWMELRTGDINFVIDTFLQKSVKGSDSFYSLIDAKSIGVAGHSLGGSAALGIARQRNDIKAVIALESPYMCDMTGVNGNEFSWNTTPYPCAMMNIYSDSGYKLIKSDNKYVQNRNFLYNNGNVEYYHIEGSNHYTLTDLVRKSPVLCALLGGGYEKSGYDTLVIVNQRCLAFFDKHLK